MGFVCFTWNTALRENDFQRPAKGGSTPAFAYQRAAIAPLSCLNLQPCFSSFNFIWIGSFQKMQLQQEKQIAKTICFANVGCSPTPRQHFWKIAGSKNFWLPAACFRETTFVRFGKAGAHPQLALGIAIAPETVSHITTFWFWRQLRFFRFSLRCLLYLIVQFDLLRKRGLLAHTSPAFLKNCWSKKLFVCLRLVAYIPSIRK